MSQLESTNSTPPETATELHSSTIPFTLWLEVNGQRTPIYSITSNTAGTELSGVVESVSEASFALGYRPEMIKPNFDFTIAAFVDGGKFEYKSWQRDYRLFSSPPDNKKRERRLATTRITHDDERELLFSKLDFAPASNHSTQPLNAKLGTIKLEVHIGELSRSRCVKPEKWDRSFFTAEVTKSAISTGLTERVGLGKKVENVKEREYSQFKNKNDKADLVFKLRYAPRAVLEREGHVKQIPETVVEEAPAVGTDSVEATTSPAPEIAPAAIQAEQANAAQPTTDVVDGYATPVEAELKDEAVPMEDVVVEQAAPASQAQAEVAKVDEGAEPIVVDSQQQPELVVETIEAAAGGDVEMTEPPVEASTVAVAVVEPSAEPIASDTAQPIEQPAPELTEQHSPDDARMDDIPATTQPEVLVLSESVEIAPAATADLVEVPLTAQPPAEAEAAPDAPEATAEAGEVTQEVAQPADAVVEAVTEVVEAEEDVAAVKRPINEVETSTVEEAVDGDDSDATVVPAKKAKSDEDERERVAEVEQVDDSLNVDLETVATADDNSKEERLSQVPATQVESETAEEHAESVAVKADEVEMSAVVGEVELAPTQGSQTEQLSQDELSQPQPTAPAIEEATQATQYPASQVKLEETEVEASQDDNAKAVEKAEPAEVVEEVAAVDAAAEEVRA